MMHAVEELARPIIECGIPEVVRASPKHTADMGHSLSRDDRSLDNEPKSASDSQNGITSFNAKSVQVTARLCGEVLHLIDFPHFAILNVGRIPNDDIEPAFSHDAVELDKPVKRFMAIMPFLIVLRLSLALSASMP